MSGSSLSGPQSAGLAAANTATPDYVLNGQGPSLPATGTSTPHGSQWVTGSGFSPTQLRHAYGIDSIQFGSIAGDGTGQTIAIIDAYHDPTAAADLHTFDQQMHLPDPPSFTQVNQTGGSALPGLDPAAIGNDWELEEGLDVEWAHAIAPGASIIVVEANSASNGDLLTSAVGWARGAPGVSAVLMGFGCPETLGENAYDGLFTSPAGHGGVTFVAAAGNAGASSVYPAFSPNVLAVGGISLTLDGSNNIASQTGTKAGGGISLYEPQPSYQQPIVPQTSSARTVPDVAFDADYNTGVAVCDSYDFGVSTPWVEVGGTSAAAACWTGLIAIADQGRALNGAPPLDGATQTLPLIYSSPPSCFRDITKNGSSFGFLPAPGYDLATGIGSPVANTLVPYLSASAPYVSSVAPTELQVTEPSQIDFNFSAAMDPASFSVASGVDAFTGPGNTDLRSSINGYSWLNNNTTLEVDFTPPTTQGPYTMTVGPQIRSAYGAAMDQNQNGISAETTADEFSGTVYFDPTPTQVAATNPADGSTVPAPFTTLDVHFSAPYDPTTVSPGNLTISQGLVSGATAIDATTVEYSLSGVNGGTLTVAMPQGALKDANGNPILAFNRTYNLSAPAPTSDWTTFQGNAGHTGYVPGTFSPYYRSILWSTTLQNASIADMSVGDGGLYLSSDPYYGVAYLPSLFALDPATGAPKWDVALGRYAYTTGTAYSDGAVFVQTTDDFTTGNDYLWSFDAASGAMNYKETLPGSNENNPSPTVADGNLYMDEGGGLMSVSVATGAVNWSGTPYSFDGWTPAVTSAYVYSYTGSGFTNPVTGQFKIMDRLTGQVLSIASDPGFVWKNWSTGTVALGSNNDAFVTQAGRLLCFSTQIGGGLNWVLNDQYTGPVIVANGVLYVDDANTLVALSEATGAKLWSWSLPNGGFVTDPIATDNILFVGDETSTYAISLATHQVLWSVPESGVMALADNRLFIAGPNWKVTAIGLAPVGAPAVVSYWPGGVQSAAPRSVEFNFAEPMDPTSFSVASGVDAFTGPGDTDLRPTLTGYAWLNNNTTLQVDFTTPVQPGRYSMTIGPQIRSAFGVAMDQNQDGTAGTPQDEFTASFNYDPTPTQVVSTNPAIESLLAPASFTTLDLHFSAPIDPSMINPGNLSISQGSIAAATLIDAQTVEYSLSGVAAGGTITVAMAQGALNDENGNPVFAFSGSYVIPTAPSPTDWGTYQGNAAHNGYVAGALDPSAHQTLWSTVLPVGSLTDMAVGGGNVYVSSNVYYASATLPSFFALSAATGAIDWQQALDSNDTTSPPAYANGMLYVETTDYKNGDYLWLFDTATGAQVAKTSIGSQTEQYLSPTVAYGSVYAQVKYYYTDSFSPTTGALNWESTGPAGQSTPSVTSAYCYLYTGGLVVLDRSTGAFVFATQDTNYQNYSNTGAVNEALALGADNDGFATNTNRVICFSTAGNVINWVVTDQYTGQVTVANGVVYVQDGNCIAALDEVSGAKLWSWTPLNDSISGRIIATDDMLFVSSGSTTYAISLATHQTLWTVAHGGHLALDDRTLYISGSNGTVTAIGLKYASAVSLAATGGPNPARADQPLAFTATVAGGVPDGDTVMLEDAANNNAVVATATLSGGTATLTVPGDTLAIGTHNLVAVFGGDATFANSQSALYAQTITPPPLPSWMAAGSQAIWDPAIHTLTVTGAAVINADPGADEPNIVESGAAAQLVIQPATSPTDI
ncbi:MAG TPA: PQQ-binding-like beta-propeller repeat protein, partial [Tepidisphaeraceae bacterium]